MYNVVTVLNTAHQIELVQHGVTEKLYIKKTLHVYNYDIYQQLQDLAIKGIPVIQECYEENGKLILIEEYISGDTLQEKIDRRELTESDILRYMNELSQILYQLHNHSVPIVHRDIKPSNLLISSCGHIYLLDFNIAKYSSPQKESDTNLIGTVGYAAPEQFGFGSSTPQTDIYALGVLLEEMVSSLSFQTSRYNKIIKRCKQIKPKDRYASVLELQKALYCISIKNKIKEQSYTPPGFRSKTPWKMALSIIVYLLWGWITLNTQINGISAPSKWLARIILFVTGLMLVTINTNYLNMKKLMPLCDNPLRIIRILGMILYHLIVVSIGFFMISIIAM